jgi:hypothetical protein
MNLNIFKKIVIFYIITKDVLMKTQYRKYRPTLAGRNGAVLSAAIAAHSKNCVKSRQKVPALFCYK